MKQILFALSSLALAPILFGCASMTETTPQEKRQAVLPMQKDTFFWARSVGVEVAPHNIQVNAIAQNFVQNPNYFPPEVLVKPKFQERLKREIPLGRLVSAREDAEFAVYLCGAAANCFLGQTSRFAVAGLRVRPSSKRMEIDSLNDCSVLSTDVLSIESISRAFR